MTIQDFIIKLDEKFHKNIIHTKIDQKELHLEISSEGINEICSHLVLNMNCTLVSLFAMDERELKGCYSIHYVFFERHLGLLIHLNILLEPNHNSFPSASTKIPAAALYEREIQDLFGLHPIGHPDAKRLVFHGNWPESNYPLRKDFPFDRKPETADEKMDFNMITGDGIFEIPVGPVHAGIIEPGHFRFSLAGEPILNLEAQLYFVHRGIEKFSEGKSVEQCFYLSERISGDESFTNSLAYCQAIEQIAGIAIPDRAAYTRVLFAELERLISHLADLAGVCTDVAYGFATSQFSMVRNWTQNAAEMLCGMRFLRSVNKPGGIRKDFLSGKEKDFVRLLMEIKKELEDTEDIVMHNSLFIDRIENTGILKNK
ncbi:MAG: NADH-quinone oxidoreductase subunit C, partial [Bacillota bacterium]